MLPQAHVTRFGEYSRLATSSLMRFGLRHEFPTAAVGPRERSASPLIWEFLTTSQTPTKALSKRFRVITSVVIAIQVELG
jgi:hypothetical protein